jgi:hypothetical protein
MSARYARRNHCKVAYLLTPRSLSSFEKTCPVGNGESGFNGTLCQLAMLADIINRLMLGGKESDDAAFFISLCICKR